MQRKIDDILTKKIGYRTFNAISKIIIGKFTSMNGLSDDLRAN